MKRTISYLTMIFMLLSMANSLRAQQEDGERPKVGLVLSGGGAKGIAHIGVLKVLEKAGLKIDYIGGTSMGSIVSGLYAIGYDADSLETIVETRDWSKLLSDEISRRDLSIEEKPDNDRFFISLPLQERKLKLPAGVITGQNIENQFAELCAHNRLRDFSKFQIPYLCVATDIETGLEKVFHEGNLASCMRASMAIPTAFSPMEIDGNLYTDGGVVNNFPSDHLKAMGADILIGVDVGFTPKTLDDDINLFMVIEQTVFMASHARMEENKKLCDILIKPDITGYDLSSFSSGDSLISRGEQAALKYFDRFKALADSLNKLKYIPYEKPSFKTVDSLFLSEIIVEGIEHVSGKLILGKLNLNVPGKVTPARISEAISKVYSSLFFEKVSYELEPMADDLAGEGVRLKIKVQERSEGQLKVGLNYNNTNKASIILNTTFRNLLVNGSKSSLNLALGENPYFLARFEKNNGWKPGFVAEFGAQDFNLNIYDEGSKIGVIDYSDISTRLYTQSIINNSYSFGLGLEYERSVMKPEVGSVIPGKQTDNYYNLLAFVNLDSYDNRFYPRRGTRIESLLKFITNPGSTPAWFLRFNLEKAASFGQRFALIPRLYGASTSADSSLRIYHSYLGGLSKSPRKGLMPFVGLNFMERSGRNALALGLDFQYNFWKSNYLILHANAANTSWYPEDLFILDNAFSGYGITLGNLSLIGPIEFTLMRPSYRNEYIFYVNIGYYF